MKTVTTLVATVFAWTVVGILGIAWMELKLVGKLVKWGGTQLGWIK